MLLLSSSSLPQAVYIFFCKLHFILPEAISAYKTIHSKYNYNDNNNHHQ